MNWELDRYKRQLGLVHQRRVMNLNILLLGEGPVLPYLAINLALLGVGTGEGKIFLPQLSKRLGAPDLQGQFFFRAEDEGLNISEAAAHRIHQMNSQVNVELTSATDANFYDAVLIVSDTESPRPSMTPVIWAGVTDYGLYVGAEKPQTRTLSPNLLTPSLASLCGGLAAQEMLRVTHCIRATEIAKFWVTLNYTFREAMHDSHEPHKFSVDGVQTIAIMDDKDAGLPIDRIPMNLGNDLVQRLFEHTLIDEPTDGIFSAPVPCFYYSPFWENRLENGAVVEQLVELPVSLTDRIILGGVGGLGSWVAALLAVSRFAGNLVIFDNDTHIENHNLNRQVLYGSHTLGLAKAPAAAHALTLLNPALTVINLTEEIEATTVVTRAALMHDADLAISTFDNFRARYVFAEWAALNHVPLINGGSDGFAGDVEVVVPEQSGCLFCWWERARGSAAAQAMSTHEEHLSCTREDANAPDVGRALVTTTAVIASMQTLLSLLTLCQPAARTDHYLGYLGKENALEKCRLSRHNGNAPCPTHEQGACEHPQQFWQMIEETLLGGDQ
ncbi:Sulfur carrier protein ThiS adenylyltransferase [Anaerolineae bacterium]|nr:Sulfur carrier protein ThiS adenylyltransferase [Anaerolineae bacterium]